ncbi:MAG: cyclic pyranopterin monophosphate synthase MoaC [Pseudomonadota bacterium]
MTDLTHIGPDGRARMVDVSEKASTTRRAVARGRVLMARETLDLATGRDTKKGDPISVAELAGIMGAKRTSDLIPLCHPLPISGVKVAIEPDEANRALVVTAAVKTTGKTGVEMEALTAVSTACLTIYDMLKAVDKGMVIDKIELLEKTGGKSGDYYRA